MTIANDNIPERVFRLEAGLAAISEDVREVKQSNDRLDGKIDRVLQALSSTDGRVAERAHAVKVEIRDEAERKSRDRNELFRNGVSLIATIGVVVTALTGPWIGMLRSTAEGQKADMLAIAAVRETLAQQGAEISRNHDVITIGLEKNRLQDQQLYDLAQRVAGGEARGGQR